MLTWHYQLDALPRIERNKNDATTFDLFVPIGVWPTTSGRVNVTIEFSIDGAAVERIGFDPTNPAGCVVPVTLDLLACKRRENPVFERPYLDMVDKLRNNINLYYEGRLLKIPDGARVTYRAVVYPMKGLAATTPWYTVYCTKPSFEFSFNDIHYMGPIQLEVLTTNVIYSRSNGNFHYLRVDFADITGTLPDFQMQVGARTFSMASDSAWMPWIDVNHDYVVLPLPKTEFAQLNSCVWQGQTIDLTTAVNRAQARIMFIHFGIQGINDLFESPNKNYKPYRTYMQTTMRDELGTYSSRPNSVESGERDGYAFTMEDHRTYNLPYMWAFNGGLLALIAHDNPGDLQQIQTDIQNNIMDPTVADFGGHRAPYYQKDTNTYIIELGIEILKNLTGSANKVYYPDSRFYKQIPNVTGALQQVPIEYLVVDGSTGFLPHKSTAQHNAASAKLYLDHTFVWQDQTTGLNLLYMDGDMKDKLFEAAPDEFRRGKLARSLRLKLLYFASHSDPANQQDGYLARHLLIYSDDADKASGNGWFDGTYGGNEKDYCDMYQAALEWISVHPWIQMVTSAHLVPANDCVGTIDMKTATDPSVDPGGQDSTDCFGKQLHFDAWYDNWKDFLAAWVGKKLEPISQEVEFAILDLPGQHKNDLHKLAQLSFAIATHELPWNKQPVDPKWGDVNKRCDVNEPEDFAICAGLQVRNAQVYLNAAVWATLATGLAPECDQGTLINTLKQLQYATDPSRGVLAGQLFDATGLHWDRDILPNSILYNDSVLVVMDKNGGRITHIFVMKNNQPVCVSGTMKAYQYLTAERSVDEEGNITCDGEVLQNTVYTPNHAYVACDVKQARGVVGKKWNPKKGVEANESCYYPDNFNAYTYTRIDNKTVEWEYVQSPGQPPTDIDAFRNVCKQDRLAKLGGGTGVVIHPDPGFKKRIHLEGNTITVDYLGTQPNHLTSNEFCVNLLAGLMHAEYSTRTATANRVELTVPSSSHTPVSVTVGIEVLGTNCQFTQDTNDAEKNLRLHRVLTDCIEVESPAGGDFSYKIDFS